MAENLLLMAGAHEGPISSEPYALALRRLKEFENRVVGISPFDTSPRDGSGLTRANLVTTRSIAKLLTWAAMQPTGAVWKASLASPSTGTLSHRLNGLKFFGKTGTLSGVTALSGYLQTSKGANLVVSVIVNGYSCSEAQAVAAVDHFYRFASEEVP
jgi:D-alanyl-D-alanine carboxypeptidase/D-alanyl-D-alanine-endopeptidase (penicillin-binding protein 4)